MKNKYFKKVTALAEEIEELESFLCHPGWKHEFFAITKPALRSPIYRGAGCDIKTYTLPSVLKKQVRRILQDYLHEKKKKFDEL